MINLFHSLTLCFPFNIFIYFWPCHVACGILVTEPGLEPVLLAVEAVLTTGPTGTSTLQRFF